LGDYLYTDKHRKRLTDPLAGKASWSVRRIEHVFERKRFQFVGTGGGYNQQSNGNQEQPTGWSKKTPPPTY